MYIPRHEELRALVNKMQLEEITCLLDDFGVPGMVDVDGMPGNVPAHRLKWLLARRKEVKPSELTPEENKRKRGMFPCGKCARLLPKGITWCQHCGASDDDE